MVPEKGAFQRHWGEWLGRWNEGYRHGNGEDGKANEELPRKNKTETLEEPIGKSHSFSSLTKHAKKDQ